MKKIKYVLLSLLFAGGISLGICYIVMPENTKAAMDVVIGYLNTPLGIAGGTIATAGGIGYLILKYVVLVAQIKHKNEIEQAKLYLTDKVSEVDKFCNVIDKEFNDVKENMENVIKECINAYENKVKSMNTKFDCLVSNLFNVLQNDPSAKVRAAVEEFKVKYDEIKVKSDISIGNVNDEIKAYEEKRMAEIEAIKADMNALYDKLKELGYERKEEINNNTEEE